MSRIRSFVPKAVALVTALSTAGVLSAVSPAHAAPYCPPFNAFMNDGVSTVVCSASSFEFQAENKAPWTTINKTPAYGYNPAACYQTYHRWMGYSDGTGNVEVGLRIVRDDGGVCSGPVLGWGFTGGFIRYFLNIYGVLETQPAGCNDAMSGVGTAQYTGTHKVACRPPVVGGDYKGGYHQVCVWMHTGFNTDHEACSTHQLYYP